MLSCTFWFHSWFRSTHTPLFYGNRLHGFGAPLLLPVHSPFYHLLVQRVSLWKGSASVPFSRRGARFARGRAPYQNGKPETRQSPRAIPITMMTLAHGV